jgi:UDP-N-acetylmuramoyl-L-alanyl-D-glutamate--2,6-diaminopimelate ligase
MLSILKNLYHYLLAGFGALITGFPSRKIKVIGITGTKGKSTTVELLNAVLEASGKKTAFLSSVHIKVDTVYEKNTTGNTMPGRLFIQQWLKRAVEAGCEYAILEVTSQGVVQHRHQFIDFDVAAMTCLHPEHIESHGSYENYRGAKVKFFKDVGVSSDKKKKTFFVNADSADANFFSRTAFDEENGRQLAEVITYSRDHFIRVPLRGNVVQLGDWLSSGFNLENAALVQAIAKSEGIDDSVIIKALAGFRGVPGRMEFFDGRTKHSAGAFKVVVDYAHTPGSFEALFTDLRVRLSDKSNKHQLIAVFGSYGEGRDQWKRPEIGKIASKYCDEIILTNEGPGEENPQVIVDQIASGISHNSAYRIILDRKEAIREAFRMARAGDIVALVGKGHESYINLGKGNKIPWNERQMAEEVLRELIS